MSYETIKYEVAEQILTITLNRPDKLNAFNGPMQKELIDAFDQADKDDDIRAIIVTGAGRGFCAGLDLGGYGDDERVAPLADARADAPGQELGIAADIGDKIEKLFRRIGQNALLRMGRHRARPRR